MQTAAEYKALKILFLAFLGGQLLFLGIASFLVFEKRFTTSNPDFANTLQTVLIILALGCILFSFRIFKSRIQGLDDAQRSLADRFTAYRAACIMRWAMLEGPCLFAIIGFMLTSGYSFLLIAGILILIYSSTAPLKNKVCRHLGISEEDLDDIS